MRPVLVAGQNSYCWVFWVPLRISDLQVYGLSHYLTCDLSRWLVSEFVLLEELLSVFDTIEAIVCACQILGSGKEKEVQHFLHSKL